MKSEDFCLNNKNAVFLFCYAIITLHRSGDRRRAGFCQKRSAVVTEDDLGGVRKGARWCRKTSMVVS